jgi:hypothetical protein
LSAPPAMVSEPYVFSIAQAAIVIFAALSSSA